MSVKMIGLVWDSPLTRDKKFIMLAYADHANHDGGDIWPSKERIERMTGYSRRSVQTITAQLVRQKILIEEGYHQPTKTIRYRMNRALLETMAQQAGSDEIPEHISAPGIVEMGGAEFAPIDGGAQNLRAQNSAMGGAEFAPNPSVEPSGIYSKATKPKKDPELFQSAPEEFPELGKYPELAKSEKFRTKWRDWHTDRKAQKKPLTPLAIKAQLQRLADFGPEKGAASIQQSIERGWAGLFPPGEQNGGSPSGKEITAENALRLPSR